MIVAAQLSRQDREREICLFLKKQTSESDPPAKMENYLHQFTDKAESTWANCRPCQQITCDHLCCPETKSFVRE